MAGISGHHSRMFPFHQGRFQGRKVTVYFSQRILVSIPPRKVSRNLRLPLHAPPPQVSIPPRKVSRETPHILRQLRLRCFHSTKEGFKASRRFRPPRASAWFPFHQGRFQGIEGPWHSTPIWSVSIPPRKVSRQDGQVPGQLLR